MPSSKPKGRTIEMEVRIAAPREAVWATLTDPSQLAQWLPPVASGMPGLGEELTFCWGPELQWHTRVVAWNLGRHLLWRDDAVPQPYTPTEGAASGAAPRPSPWRSTGRWRRPVGRCWCASSSRASGRATPGTTSSTGRTSAGASTFTRVRALQAALTALADRLFPTTG